MEETGTRPNDDWAEALRLQKEERAREAENERAIAESELTNSNREVFDDAVRNHQRILNERRDANRRGAAQLLSSYKIASSEGGRIPPDMLPGLNDALGFDGRNRAVYGGAVMPDGRLCCAIAQKDPNTGSVVRSVSEIDPSQIYNMSRENPGIFSRDEMEGLRDLIVRNRNMTKHMADRDVPSVPAGWGEVRRPAATMPPNRNPGRVQAQANPQVARSVGSVFSSDGRGGFSNTNIGVDGSMSREEWGTRGQNYGGRWKLLSAGADPNGQNGEQIRRYENDATGEVVTVRDGERPPWEAQGMSEKERIAQMKERGLNERAAGRDNARRELAEIANGLKRYGIDISAELKKRGLDIQEQRNEESVRHNKAVEEAAADAEKGRNDRAKQANDVKVKLAEMKGGGVIGGRPPTAHEYVEVMKFAGDRLQSDQSRAQARELGGLIADSLKKRGENVPEVSQGGKAEVKTGDNGGDDNSPSAEYPGYSKGKAKRAIAAGWTWNSKTNRFEPPKK